MYESDLGMILVKLDNCKTALEEAQKNKKEVEKAIQEKEKHVEKGIVGAKKFEEKVAKAREKLNRLNEDKVQLVEIQEIYQSKLVSYY